MNLLAMRKIGLFHKSKSRSAHLAHQFLWQLLHHTTVEGQHNLSSSCVGHPHIFDKPHENGTLVSSNTTFGDQSPNTAQVWMRRQSYESAAASDEMMAVPLWHGLRHGSKHWYGAITFLGQAWRSLDISDMLKPSVFCFNSGDERASSHGKAHIVTTSVEEVR